MPNVAADCVPPAAPSRTPGHLTALGLNAAVGGLTAALFARSRGEPVGRALARGAAGGGVSYGGKWISAQPWDGAGALGRQLSALGAAEVANAGAGRGALERFFVPMGPIQLHVDRVDAAALAVKLDLLSTLSTVYAVAHPELRLHWPSTLSAGAAVFHDRRERSTSIGGHMVGGTIVVRHPPGTDAWTKMFAHERVHVAQHDFIGHVVGDPLEGWIVQRLGRGERLHRRLDLGADFLIWGTLQLLTRDHHQLPWEREAYFLSGFQDRI